MLLFKIVILSLAILTIGTNGWSNESDFGTWESHSSFGSVRVWSRNWIAPKAELAERLSSELPQILNFPLFKDRLPSVWGLLIDNTVADSLAGFWSPSLRDPQGNPAIAVRPRDLMDPSLTRGLVSHELGHLIHTGARPGEESWMREGVAMMIQSRITGHPHSCLTASQLIPGTSLTASLDPSLPDYAVGTSSSAEHCAQYGHIFQFFAYLQRLCGGNRLFEELLTSKSELSGIAFVDAVLRSHPQEHTLCSSFESAFRAFETARFAQDPSDPERFAILTQTPIAVSEMPATHLAPYSAQAYWLRSPTGEHAKSPRDCRRGDSPLDRDRCLQINLKGDR